MPRGACGASLREGALCTCGILAGERRPGSLSGPGHKSRCSQTPAGTRAVPALPPLPPARSLPGREWRSRRRRRSPERAPTAGAPPRPGPAPHWRSPPPVAAGRPGHPRLIRRGVLGLGPSTGGEAARVGVAGRARGWRPRSRPRAGVSGKQRRQLAARNRRREPGSGRRALPRLRLRNGGRLQGPGTGAQSKAHCGSQQSVPPARCSRPGAPDSPARSPGQRRPPREGGHGPLSWWDFKEPRGASPAAHSTALAPHAGTDPNLAPSRKPSWTPRSASFQQPGPWCKRSSENCLPERNEARGWGQCGC